MRKLVAVFPDQETGLQAARRLVAADIADYSLLQLGEDFEQQIRQNIFIRPVESRLILGGAALGALLLGLLFYSLGTSGDYGSLIARLLPAQTAAPLLLGMGAGLAGGGLLGGLYGLSLPLGDHYEGQWLMVLYCTAPHARLARDLMTHASGVLLN